jgi:hypothetical protein
LLAPQFGARKPFVCFSNIDATAMSEIDTHDDIAGSHFRLSRGARQKLLILGVIG